MLGSSLNLKKLFMTTNVPAPLILNIPFFWFWLTGSSPVVRVPLLAGSIQYQGLFDEEDGRPRMVLSGLQKDVLHLFRALLRTARLKDSSGKLQRFVSLRFREESSSVSRFDFKLIEHQLRWGYKQKKLMESPGFSAASVNLES